VCGWPRAPGVVKRGTLPFLHAGRVFPPVARSPPAVLLAVLILIRSIRHVPRSAVSPNFPSLFVVSRASSSPSTILNLTRADFVSPSWPRANASMTFSILSRSHNAASGGCLLDTRVCGGMCPERRVADGCATRPRSARREQASVPAPFPPHGVRDLRPPRRDLVSVSMAIRRRVLGRVAVASRDRPPLLGVSVGRPSSAREAAGNLEAARDCRPRPILPVLRPTTIPIAGPHRPGPPSCQPMCGLHYTLLPRSRPFSGARRVGPQGWPARRSYCYRMSLTRLAQDGAVASALLPRGCRPTG